MPDWQALIRPVPVTPCDVVTAPCVVTEKAIQAIESKQSEAGCNHVTTVSTQSKGEAGSHVLGPDQLPGGEWCGTDRASTNTQTPDPTRATLHYRLHDERKGTASIVGAPGDTLADLLHDLVQRYGPRLDLESVRETFEERAAIMEFDAGMSRTEAERAAAGDVRHSTGPRTAMGCFAGKLGQS